VYLPNSFSGLTKQKLKERVKVSIRKNRYPIDGYPIDIVDVV